MVKKELLEVAREEVKKEIKRVGFIDDSDNLPERFLDDLAKDLECVQILWG